MKLRIGFSMGIALMCLSACSSHAKAPPAPAPTKTPPMTFAIPVGMLPVNVVGSYGGGNAFARRIGAGKHALPSGIGVPVDSATAKQSSWACMVLMYGTGAAVQYEGMGRCGIDKRFAEKRSAPCEIPLPRKNPAQTKGKIVIGWCAAGKRANKIRSMSQTP